MSRYDDRTRALAVADYQQTRDPYATVAARHGVSRAILHAWVNPKPVKARGPKVWDEDEIGLTGGRWVNVRGVQRWVSDGPVPQEPDRPSDRARRIQAEDAQFTEAGARAAHARFFAGDRSPKTVLGERVYQRRMKREKRARQVAA